MIDHLIIFQQSILIIFLLNIGIFIFISSYFYFFYELMQVLPIDTHRFLLEFSNKAFIFYCLCDYLFDSSSNLYIVYVILAEVLYRLLLLCLFYKLVLSRDDSVIRPFKGRISAFFRNFISFSKGIAFITGDCLDLSNWLYIFCKWLGMPLYSIYTFD